MSPSDPGRLWPLVVQIGRLNARLETGLAYLAGLFLAGFTLVVLIDVIYRQVLVRPLLWPSEWSVMMFVWSVLLGASVAARRRMHFVVEALPALSPRVDLALHLVATLLAILFACVLLYFGYQMTLTGTRRFTPMMGYPMIYVFAAFPVAGLAILLFSLEHLLELLAGKVPARTGEDGPA